ncbi:hypothetical protein AB6A40_008652 [Gnathostoma spinigerum]|uniref:UBX domain-containing protein n=1 Tax=Gnathostoma spinigerum TaxID=75299 RepID=A0ABD6EXZ1_9BILA
MPFLTVICPNARRSTVKVSPSTIMYQVLEEACLKNGFDVDAHRLKHQNRLIDCSLTFRLSGLANNATVEMVHVETSPVSSSAVAEVALQLSDGTRLLRKFSIDTSLFEILREFSKDVGHDLINCEEGKVASCTYMHKEFRGPIHLSLATLKSLGFTGGRCLLRYAALEISCDEICAWDERVMRENQRTDVLKTAFSERKAENEKREQVHLQRELEFERELSEKRKQRSNEDPSSCFDSGVRENVEPRLSADLPSNSTLTSRISHSNRADSSGVDRLEYLQNLLPEVDGNLNERESDSVQEACHAFVTRRAEHPTTANATSKPEFNDFKFPESSAKNDIPSQSEVKVPSNQSVRTLPEKCDRNAVIFSNEKISDESNLLTAKEVSDEFFEPSVADLRNHQSHLTEQARLANTRALVSKKFIDEKNRQLKVEAYRHSVIRFHLPDSRIIQALFLSLEPVSQLFDFVASILLDSPKIFCLRLVLNQKIDRDETRTLLDAGLSPRSAVSIRTGLNSERFLVGVVLLSTVSLTAVIRSSL